jgi:hypothetical protein
MQLAEAHLQAVGGGFGNRNPVHVCFLKLHGMGKIVAHGSGLTRRRPPDMPL